jgi:hypothetical protein
MSTKGRYELSDASNNKIEDRRQVVKVTNFLECKVEIKVPKKVPLEYRSLRKDPYFKKTFNFQKQLSALKTNRDSVDQQISTHQVLIRKLFAKKTHRDRGGS